MKRNAMTSRFALSVLLITGTASVLLPQIASAATPPPQNQTGGISELPEPKEIAGPRLRKEAIHVGGFAGFSDVPNDRTGALFGVEAGSQPWRRVSLGGNLGLAGVTQDNSRMMLFGQAAYHFVDSNTPIIKHGYASMNAGWFRDSVDVAPGLTATTYYPGFGPTLGFDLPVEKTWAVGAEAKYIVNFKEGPQNTFLMLASVKRWL